MTCAGSSLLMIFIDKKNLLENRAAQFIYCDLKAAEVVKVFSPLTRLG